ncbi:YceI family protein [Puniceicoccales bacterium CK1056]|uniref:YceI family protein n=1 Tax=Oceanipulchritudo coccoides TaxID=2706888 RepID=A0A6B2M1H5_9BACT|nr:YceI family protein [Oceanipulchritudo coccoides]NDV62778.1 YceI family protein [Oceanipulchritudo coccoides]
MNKKSLIFLLAGLLSAFSLNAEKIVYKIDPVHSGISFKIRHFINKIPGNFDKFSGEIHFDKETPANSKAVATIDVASVDTRNEDRDAHLQNEDFFKATEFPQITFTSTEWVAIDEDSFEVTGLLSILGVEKPVTLNVEYLGEVEGRGTIRSGWEGTTTINRKDWGMGYGSPAVGTEVQIELNIQAHRVAEEESPAQ